MTVSTEYVNHPGTSIKEDHLIRQARSGNVKAFTQLYDACIEHVYRYVYFNVGNDLAAKAVTVRVFPKAWEQIKLYKKSRQPFLAWLFAVAREQITVYYQTHKRIVSELNKSVLLGQGPYRSEEIQAMFNLQALRDGLQALSEEERQLLMLKFIIGLPTEQAADLMAKPEEDILALQMKALRGMARSLSETTPDIEENVEEFYRTLENCLFLLLNKIVPLDDCLRLYPKQAGYLRPLLRSALVVSRGQTVTLPHSFSAHARSEMMQYITFNPPQALRITIPWRTASVLAMLVIAFLTAGTARAQSALPGDTFYGWKRSSERLWLAVTPDPVAAEVLFANRRLDEWVAVADDSALSAGAKDDYQKALSDLESLGDEKALALVAPMIESHRQLLKNAGLDTPELDNYLTQIEALDSIDVPTVVATEVPTEAPVDNNSNAGGKGGGNAGGNGSNNAGGNAGGNGDSSSAGGSSGSNAGGGGSSSGADGSSGGGNAGGGDKGGGDKGGGDKGGGDKGGGK
jgi:RNA polymerase sigma factor (sigma-70 family)